MSKSAAMDVGKSKRGTMGLTFTMLTKTNYTTWAIKMKVSIQAHGVWEAVEPSDPNAMVEDITYKIAFAMIYQSIPE